ncbi:MAG TPA: TIGR03936 family radical SAM-associated protein [Dehalococcoidia bacterium]|nr:TIGR03936 family radical SAM-associated protein [Dehalococcoidia bacterium]
MKAQRLRVTFTREEPVRYISHLDLMRFWERALRRADLPLAYSQGFTTSPQISIAAPLALGVTSSCEMMDVYLSGRVSPYHFTKALSQQLPPGFQVLAVQEVGQGALALQTLVRWAEYEVEAVCPFSRQELEERVRDFLLAPSVPWQHRRQKEVRQYDLRALVVDLRLLGLHSHPIPPGQGSHAVGWPFPEGKAKLAMRLRTDSTAAGRPEQVVAALGLPGSPLRIHRSQLILADSSPAREAWRRQGRFE